ncbi:MAG: crotonase/enoyl-CoA hydratase family protein [Rhizobiaceae bacterium]|nr:crotonase/enoyl-CoA hydratase family protein [Rhizobiaceae bacterium]
MPELQSTFFKVVRRGAVVHLAMNRPDRSNAMSPDFWTGLPQLMRDLANDAAVRCVVISGEGRNFSGGMDLQAFAGISKLFDGEPGRAAHAMRQVVLDLQDAFNAIERAPFPVICAIHGACIGAGVDLITACDLRLASKEAFFAIEEIHIGMAADVGTLQRLPKLIAPAVAAELAFTGRRFSAAEAHSFGLVSSVLETPESVLEAAFELAEAIAKKSPLAIAGIKRNLHYARDHSVADGLDYIATWNGGMLRPADLMTAVQAKMAKQEAEFANLLKPAG